jgi:F-type H+-transporting ATPase subunit a
MGETPWIKSSWWSTSYIDIMFIYCLSPLEQFEVLSLVSISSPLLNFNFTLSNIGLFTIISVILLLTLHSQGLNDLILVQSRMSLFIETIFATISTITREQMGTRNEIYIPFIYALFTFILCVNLIGNVSYTFTVATSAVVSLGISLITWFGVTLLAIDRHRLHFLSYFVPAGTPLILVPVLVLIELISYLARAVSLGLRLAANLASGHTLIVILGGFLFSGFSSGFLVSILTLIPFSLFLAIVGLELAVSFIQAYVFTILTCIYMKDSLDLH